MNSVNLAAQDQSMDATNLVAQGKTPQGAEKGMKRHFCQGLSNENESTSKRQYTDDVPSDGLGEKRNTVDENKFGNSNSGDIPNGQNLSSAMFDSTKERSNDRNDSDINSDKNEMKKKDVGHEEDEELVEEEEPDWDTIAQHEPANNDVPIFLTARDRREEAEARFGAALDEAHATFKQCCDDFLKIAANLFHDQKEKLLAMEDQIKQDFVENEASRSQMQKNLEQSASAAQEQFAQLMRRVTQMNKKI